MPSDSPPIVYALVALATVVFFVKWFNPGKHSVRPHFMYNNAMKSRTLTVRLGSIVPGYPSSWPDCPLALILWRIQVLV